MPLNQTREAKMSDSGGGVGDGDGDGDSTSTSSDNDNNNNKIKMCSMRIEYIQIDNDWERCNYSIQMENICPFCYTVMDCDAIAFIWNISGTAPDTIVTDMVLFRTLTTPQKNLCAHTKNSPVMLNLEIRLKQSGMISGSDNPLSGLETDVSIEIHIAHRLFSRLEFELRKFRKIIRDFCAKAAKTA